MELTYIHINIDKLEFRAVKCVLLGYLEGLHGYKMWKWESGGVSGVIISRDVFHFDRTHIRMK